MFRWTYLPLVAGLALAGCGERDVVLPGLRLSPDDVMSASSIVGDSGITGAELRLGAARSHGDWPQRASGPAHDAGHMAFAGPRGLAWSASIGTGGDRGHRVTAEPVVAQGMVFTLDAQSGLMAHNAANGAAVWRANLTPAGDTAESATGGGIAYSEGKVLATTGFGELVALDAATGQIQWRQRVDAPVSGAPAVADGVAYVVATNATGWAVRIRDGRVMWRQAGQKSPAGVMGVAAPAIAGDVVIFPYPSGELAAVERDSGLSVWSGYVAGDRVGRSVTALRDLTGEPVVSNGRVYAASSSGRAVALDATSGGQIWSALHGGTSAPAVSGNSVFVVDDENRLTRLDAATGGTVWQIPLPLFLTDRVKRQAETHVHYGPVLASGRLIVASSDGWLRLHDAASGRAVGKVAIPGGAAAAPVIVGGVMYVVSRDGRLHAFQ